MLDLSEAINLVAYRLIGSGLSERAYGPALSLLISGRKFEWVSELGVNARIIVYPEQPSPNKSLHSTNSTK